MDPDATQELVAPAAEGSEQFADVVGPGMLTEAEAVQIQALVDELGTPVDVIGSRASGKGRNIDTDLPVGKQAAERSDIDFRYDGQADIDSRGQLSDKLGDVGGGAGSPASAIGAGGGEAPVLEFRPNQPPRRRTE